MRAGVLLPLTLHILTRSWKSWQLTDHKHLAHLRGHLEAALEYVKELQNWTPDDMSHLAVAYSELDEETINEIGVDPDLGTWRDWRDVYYDQMSNWKPEGYTPS